MLSNLIYCMTGGGGSASLVQWQSVLFHCPAMRVVRASLLTASVSALLKPVRNLAVRGGAMRALQRQLPECWLVCLLPDRINHNCTQVLPSMTSRMLPPMAARCISTSSNFFYNCSVDAALRDSPHAQVAFSQFEGKVCFAQNVASA